MKKSVVMAVLGLAAAGSTTAFGQGAINIGNYRGAYNPVVWDASVPTVGGQRIQSSQGVILTLFYAEGTLAANQLTSSLPLTWNTVAQGNGFVGYYDSITVNLPQWNPGDTYTFQIRASGNSSFGPVNQATSISALWFEQANIGDVSATPPGPPGISANSIGLSVQVPEPSTLVLAGLGGLAALTTLRRRS